MQHTKSLLHGGMLWRLWMEGSGGHLVQVLSLAVWQQPRCDRLRETCAAAAAAGAAPRGGRYQLRCLSCCHACHCCAAAAAMAAVVIWWLHLMQVEKGTQGIDGRVVNPRSKGTSATQPQQTMGSFAGAWPRATRVG